MAATAFLIKRRTHLNLVGQFVEYCLGCSFGRWDIRYATGERKPPELPDPFDPLPVCPPGMLQNADGLPAAPEDVPADYPLRITWSGIPIDDPGHPEDVVTRVREALTVIWGERAAAIEQEACEILGIKQLRDYFAEKKAGSPFFKDHLSRYSKSRRQAPIYWPLSTASGTYTFWVYYHRFDPNTLYSLLRLAGDKLGFEERKLAELTQEAGPDPTAKQRKVSDDQERFVSELRGFITELNRIAPLWKPDLNDGVIINSARSGACYATRPGRRRSRSAGTSSRRATTTGHTWPCTSGPSAWCPNARPTAASPSPMGWKTPSGWKRTTANGNRAPSAKPRSTP